MPGKMIVIEGLDGSGKSTLAEKLSAHISTHSQVVRYAEPGGTELSERIRSLLKDPDAEINYHAEALLFAAARAQLAEKIRADLQQGKWVLLDRWVYSSIAYQGAARGLGVSAIENINLWAAEGLTPDAWIYLRLSLEEAARRRRDRGLEIDRIEAEGDSFFELVAAEYDRLAEGDPRAIVLSADSDPELLSEQAIKLLEEREWS